MLFRSLFAVSALAQGIAGYTLVEDYFSNDFFDNFDFYTGADPTDGYVVYVDESTAQSGGLVSTSNGAYIGVDSTTVNPSGGRDAVRITSTAAYNAGSLVIIDIAHMPGGICGVWPAFWMLGGDWPNNGEIDIVEGVDLNTQNQMTLHTSDDCTIDDSGFSGNLLTSNCYVDAPDQSTNAGCSIQDSSTSSFGSGFNSNNGGVFATVWDTSSIDVFFFPRNSIPGDITSGSPDPSGWGTPSGHFTGSCDISTHFNNLQIVFDTTFCGQWAGADFTDTTKGCAALASTCNDYVANNPGAFADAYWLVNGLKVYNDNSATSAAELVANLTSANNASSPNAESAKAALPTYPYPHYPSAHVGKHRHRRYQPHGQAGFA